MTSPSELEMVRLQVAELSTALIANHPTIPKILSDIHRMLLAFPECVTGLEEDEVAKIVEGLQHHTKIDLAQMTVTKAKSKSAKDALKNVNVNDL